MVEQDIERLDGVGAFFIVKLARLQRLPGAEHRLRIVQKGKQQQEIVRLQLSPLFKRIGR